VWVWCAVFGVLTGGGLWRYARRGTWQARGTARVLRVWEAEPADGWNSGVPAEVGYVDPVTGREEVGTTSAAGGTCGEIAAAWPGMPLEVWARSRRPGDFRVTAKPAGPLLRHGRVLLPAAALPVLPVLRWAAGGTFGNGGNSGEAAGLLLCSFGAVLAVTVLLLQGTVLAESRRRGALLADAVDVTGRVIGIRERRAPDADRSRPGADTPVVAFTTADGRAVTGVCEMSLRDHAERVGREVPLRYAVADPAVFVLARGPRVRHRDDSLAWFTVVLLLLIAGGLVAGGVAAAAG
jgi:hypothetical protein